MSDKLVVLIKVVNKNGEVVSSKEISNKEIEIEHIMKFLNIKLILFIFIFMSLLLFCTYSKIAN